MGFGSSAVGVGQLTVAAIKKAFASSDSSVIAKEGLVKIFSQLTNTLFLDINTECILTVEGNQTIRIKCEPPTDQPWPEESAACQLDLAISKDKIQRIHELERQQWKQQPAKVRKSVQDEIEQIKNIYSEMDTCKSCEFENISQYNVLNVKQSCSISNEQLAKWKSTVAGNIETLMYSRKDVLGGLMKALGKDTKQEAVDEFITRINTVNFREMESSMYDNIKSSQTFLFTGASSSFRGVSQKQAIASGTKLIVDAGFFDTVMTQQEWDVYEEISAQNVTLDDAGDVVARTILSVTDLITTTFGYVVIGIVSLAILLIIALAIYIFMIKTPK